MRPTRIAVSLSLLLLLAAPSARAASFWMVGIDHVPESGGSTDFVYSIDTATGILVRQVHPAWNFGVFDIAELGGVIHGEQFGPSCAEREAIWVWSFDLATSAAGYYLPTLDGAVPQQSKIGGLTSDGSRLFASNRLWTSGCGGFNQVTAFDPGGTITETWTFPGPVDFERIAFSPDGRLYAIDMVTEGTRRADLYELDRTALTATLVGSHVMTATSSVYRDMAFAWNGELWAIEREAEGQRLQRIDPVSGALLQTVALPAVPAPPAVAPDRLYGLAAMSGPTPATPATWGRIKAEYRH
jgi:hypothetical protein